MIKSEINNILQWNINWLKNNYEFLQELLYNKEITIACIQETNLKDKDTIQIKNYTGYYRNRSECILSVYKIYLSNHYTLDITELKSLINQIPTLFILLRNFNSHNSLWNSYKTDERGKQIETFINNNNIIIINDNAPTHLNVSNGNLTRGGRSVRVMALAEIVTN